MRIVRIVTIVFFACSVTPHLYAQAIGKFEGTVADPTGAAIPQAKVTVVEERTGVTRSTLTSGAGTYSLVKLPVGIYTVSAEARGFKAASIEATLDVDQTREVNFNMALAGTITRVEVSSSTALLDTTDATLSGLIDEKQVSTLPLNGRDMVGLAFLEPGVQQPVVVTGFHTVANPLISSNGGQSQTGGSTMDGFDTSDYDLGGAQFTNFNLDAIAEFRILQNNYSAAYGGNGSIISVVTKSGTNEFHGSAFEFIRNNVLDAGNWFSAGTGELPFKRNEFGATFGGPVIKNHTFFFGEYAGFRQSQLTPLVVQVPTAAERKGIVNIIGSNGHPDQLTVPLNPDAQTVLQAYPMPNDPTGSFGPNTLSTGGSNPKTANQWSIRIDHRISDKDSLFGRFSDIHNAVPVLEPFLYILNPEWTSFRTYNEVQAGIAWTHIFGSNLVSTARFSYEDSDQIVNVGSHSVTSTTFSDGSLANYGPDAGGFAEQPQPWNYHENITWNKGRHSIETGVDFVRLIENNWGGNYSPQGTFSFQPTTPLPVAIPSASGNNNIAAGTPSPSSLISFMEGVPQTYIRQAPFPGFGPTTGQTTFYRLRSFNVAGYVQDDFKATRKLTLNLGFRYEYNSVPYETQGQTLGVLDSPRLRNNPLYLKLVLNVTPFYYPDYTGVGPRLGMAYQAGEKTVVRGGFGVLTNRPIGQLIDDEATGYLSAGFASATLPVYSLTPLNNSSAPVVTDLNGNPLPPPGGPSKIPPNTLFNLGPVTQFLGGPIHDIGVSQSLRNGYILESNLTVEQEFPGEVMAQLGWVENNGVKLFGLEYPNAYTGADPQYTPVANANGGNVGEMFLHNNVAHSTYNALQAVVRKTSQKHGIDFQASFTWSKLLSNQDALYGGASNDGDLLQDPTCFSCGRALSVMDFPLRFVTSILYNVPFDHWESLSALPKALTGGWQVSGIVSGQSGFPFGIYSPRGVQGFGFSSLWGTSAATPDLVQPLTFNHGQVRPNQLFSNAVVADAITGAGKYLSVPGCPDLNCAYQSRSGTLRRNAFRTPSFWNGDYSLVKNTKVGERLTVQFRIEAFNLLNQHAFSYPGAQIGSNTFGVATSTVNPARQIQFGLRLIF
jgi:hypothetical protein